MAAICTITLILIANLAITWCIICYANDERESNYPTFQQHILEAAQPYMYGLKCRMEFHFDGDGGLINWMETLPLKVLQFITGYPPGNQLYVCQLDWKLLSFQFSVKANGWVGVDGEDSWMPYKSNAAVALWVMLALATLLAIPPLVYYLAGYYPEYMGYEEVNIVRVCGNRRKAPDNLIQQTKAVEVDGGEKSVVKLAK